jgi:hypothetical protein
MDTKPQTPVPTRTRINYPAVAVAAVAAFVASSIYYTVFGGVWLSLRGLDPATASVTPHLWEVIGQLLRNLTVAGVLAALLKWLQANNRRAALRLALVLWVGFEAMAIAGSVLHEHYPVGLYALHVGDALIATVIMALVLGSWQHRTSRQRPARTLDAHALSYPARADASA